MRILFLTLIMSFLSHSAFGADESGGASALESTGKTRPAKRQKCSSDGVYSSEDEGSSLRMNLMCGEKVLKVPLSEAFFSKSLLVKPLEREFLNKCEGGAFYINSEVDPKIICNFFISTQAIAGWSKVCNVYAFIYVNRFIEEIKIAPCFFNCQKLLLISLVLAQKYIDDVPLANVDIPTVISRLDPALTSEVQGLNLQEVNSLEKALFKSLEQRLYVSEEELKKKLKTCNTNLMKLAIILKDKITKQKKRV
jgi:hypothetical protein